MSKKEADADSVGAAGPRAPGSPDVTSPKPLSEGGARSQWRDVCHNRKKRRPGRGTWPLGTDGNRKTSRGAALPLPLPGLDDPRRFFFFPHPKRTRCTRSGLEGPEEGRKTPSPSLPGQRTGRSPPSSEPLGAAGVRSAGREAGPHPMTWRPGTAASGDASDSGPGSASRRPRLRLSPHPWSCLQKSPPGNCVFLKKVKNSPQPFGRMP